MTLVSNQRSPNRRKGRRLCGAKTRAGGCCQVRAEPGKARCRFHGGKSTGPKTQAGRGRIAEAQRLRWRAYRDLPGFQHTLLAVPKFSVARHGPTGRRAFAYAFCESLSTGVFQTIQFQLIGLPYIARLTLNGPSLLLRRIDARQP